MAASTANSIKSVKSVKSGKSVKSQPGGGWSGLSLSSFYVKIWSIFKDQSSIHQKSKIVDKSKLWV